MFVLLAVFRSVISFSQMHTCTHIFSLWNGKHENIFSRQISMTLSFVVVVRSKIPEYNIHLSLNQLFWREPHIDKCAWKISYGQLDRYAIGSAFRCYILSLYSTCAHTDSCIGFCVQNFINNNNWTIFHENKYIRSNIRQNVCSIVKMVSVNDIKFSNICRSCRHFRCFGSKLDVSQKSSFINLEPCDLSSL